jgi:hypothetical protein
VHKEIRNFLKIKYGLFYDETLSKLIKEQRPIRKEKGRYKKREPSSNQETSSQSTNMQTGVMKDSNEDPPKGVKIIT